MFQPLPDHAVTSSALAHLIGDDSDAGGEEEEGRNGSTALSPVTSPPYWLQTHQSVDGSHSRAISNLSTESVAPITLRDNEAEGDGASDVEGTGGLGAVLGRDRNRGCWAKSVEVTDHVLVNGSATNIGAFAVWNIRVETLSVSSSAEA